MSGKPSPEYQCKATSKRTGERCQKWRMRGKDHCDIHGGKSLRGMELPQFKHGGWSRSLPDRLSQRYQEILNDEQRHDLRNQIALADAKIVDLLKGMERGESDRLWVQLRKMERAFRRANRRDEQEIAADLLGEMLEIIQKGGDEALAWADVDRWLYRQGRAIEQDLRVAQIKHQVITIDEFMAMMGRLLEIIQTGVHNKDDMRRVAEGIRRELESPGGDGVVVPVWREGAE